MPLTNHIAHVAMSNLEQLDVDATFACRQPDGGVDTTAAEKDRTVERPQILAAASDR